MTNMVPIALLHIFLAWSIASAPAVEAAAPEARRLRIVEGYLKKDRAILWIAAETSDGKWSQDIDSRSGIYWGSLATRKFYKLSTPSLTEASQVLVNLDPSAGDISGPVSLERPEQPKSKKSRFLRITCGNSVDCMPAMAKNAIDSLNSEINLHLKIHLHTLPVRREPVHVLTGIDQDRVLVIERDWLETRLWAYQALLYERGRLLRQLAVTTLTHFAPKEFYLEDQSLIALGDAGSRPPSLVDSHTQRVYSFNIHTDIRGPLALLRRLGLPTARYDTDPIAHGDFCWFAHPPPRRDALTRPLIGFERT